LGQAEGLEVGVREGRDVAAHGGEAEASPALTCGLERDADLGGQLVPRQGGFLAEEVRLEEVDQVLVVDRFGHAAGSPVSRRSVSPWERRDGRRSSGAR